MIDGSRAQSEVLGTALLLGVTVIAITGFGVFYLDAAIPDADEPTADFSADANATALVVAHEGGDSLSSAALRLAVDVNGTRRAVAWDEAYLSGGDAQFDPGESWTNDSWIYPDARTVSVTLVHDPSGTVLHRETLRPEAEESTPAGYSPGAGTTPATNRDPVARFAYSPPSPEEGESVTFDASGSSDPENDPLTYEWDFDDDGTTDATGLTPSHTYRHPDDGTVTAALTVTDDHGNVHTTRQTVSVANVAPAATFAVSPSSPTAGEPATYDASGSFDAGNDPLTYAWDFDDDGTFETTTASPTVRHTYDSAGDRDATLRVRDGDGGEDVWSETVSVRPADTTAPTVSDFSASNPSGRNVSVTFDADEPVSTVAVELADGSGNAVATFVRSDFDGSCSSGTCTYALSPAYEVGADGTYTATLNAAEDAAGNDGASGQTATVSVQSRTADPGQAFVDRDGDGYYEPAAGDFTVDLAAKNYRYDAAAAESASLVVPASVSTLRPTGNGEVSLAGENLTVRTDADASGRVVLEATSGSATVSGVTLDNTAGGDSDVSVTAAESVDVANSVVRSDGAVSISASTSLSGRGVTVDTTASGDSAISVTAGTTLDVGGGSLIGDGTVTASAPGRVTADGATIRTTPSGPSDLRVESTGAGLVATGATIESDGAVQLAAATTASVADATISAVGYDRAVEISAPGSVTLSNADLTSSGPVTVTASGGSVAADGATIDTAGTYGMRIRVEGAGDVDLSSATLATDSAKIVAEITASQRSSTVSVGGASFSGYDSPDRGKDGESPPDSVDELIVTGGNDPKKIAIDGTPASGEVEVKKFP
jgi:PKD repeat protein